MKRNILLGMSFVFCLIVLSVQARTTDENFEKEYQESYQVNENAKLLVGNKYGDVFLTAWDKNEIKIDVIVKVQSKSKSARVSDYFEAIDVAISGDENLVEAFTKLPSFKHKGSLDISIDYHISLPATIQLDISQKYGSVILNNDWKGETDFEVSYGNLQTRALNNRDNSIEIQYGEFIAESIAVARLDISYSEASIEKATKLDVNTSYGDIELGVVASLDLKTAFDDIEIKEITDLYARSDYSDIEIGKVINSIDLDVDFGEISIDNVVKGFKSVKIDSDNSGVEVHMDESASYTYEVVTRYGDFYLKNDKSMSKEKLSFNAYKYTGTVGSSANRGEIIIDSSYASVEIK